MKIDDNKYDINTLFEKVFGVQDIHIFGSVNIQTSDDGFNTSVNPGVVEQYRHIRRISAMGTPVMFPFTLKGGRCKAYNKDGVLENVSYRDFLMPSATLTDFRRSMIVNDTPVLGGKGTVKEMFGFEDWRIRMRGICFNDYSRIRQPFAYDQQKELVRWAQVADSIPVIGELFSDKGIYSIVLKDVSFRQLQASINMLPFEIMAISDNPIELIHLL